MLGAAVVGAEYPHAADQHGHLRRGQAHQLGAVEHQLFGTDDIVLLEPVAIAVMEGFHEFEGIRIGHLVRRIPAAG